jgi:hypothetical protein
VASWRRGGECPSVASPTFGLLVEEVLDSLSSCTHGRKRLTSARSTPAAAQSRMTPIPHEPHCQSSTNSATTLR